METILITFIGVFSVAIIALGTFWFIRAARSRDDAKPVPVRRGSVVVHRWDGTGPRSRN